MNDKEIKNIKTSEDLVEFIKLKTSNSSDMYFRKVSVLEEDIYILYIMNVPHQLNLYLIL